MTRRILLVEDTEDNRHIVRDLMESVGYDLIEAEDGAAGVAIVGTDPTGRITLWNPGAEALLGYTAEEVLGRAPSDFHRPQEIQRLASVLGVPSDYPSVVKALADPDRGGLEVEGLGIVFLEASATGLPVVAGRSGGSPDAVLDLETGHVVDGTSVHAVAKQVAALLADPDRGRAMGRAGRTWVEREWRWDVLAGRLRSLLSGEL